jgi:hypothetical protein
VGEVRLIGARIGGSLDLTGAQVESLNGPAIDLADATIESTVFLIEDPAGRRPVIRGRLDMGSARISGRFLIRNATIEARAGVTPGSIYARATASGTAISAARLSVGDEVMLTGRCEVTGGIDMSMGDVSSLSIGEDCVLRAPGRTALDLTNAEIRAHFRLDGNAAVEGSIRLAGAAIHGTLALHGQLSHPGPRALVGGSAMTVDGDVYLDGLRADGGLVNFRGATLGSLTADGAQLHNPGGYSLRLSQALIKGSVLLVNGFTSTGLIALNRSTIEGRLQLTGGSFTCPAAGPDNEHGHAIEAISTTVRGGMDLGWKTVSPSVDFTDAVTTFLADDPAAWPARFTIAGLTYERFEKPQGGQPKRIWDQVAQACPPGRPLQRHLATTRHRRYLLDHRLRLPALARPVAAGGTSRSRRRIARIARNPGHAAGDQRQRARVLHQWADRGLCQPPGTGPGLPRRPAACRCMR